MTLTKNFRIPNTIYLEDEVNHIFRIYDIFYKFSIALFNRIIKSQQVLSLFTVSNKLQITMFKIGESETKVSVTTWKGEV